MTRVIFRDLPTVFITNCDINQGQNLVAERTWLVFNDEGKKRFWFKVTKEFLETTEAKKFIVENISYLLK